MRLRQAVTNRLPKSPHKHLLKSERGYSLVELIIAMGVILIIAGIAVPALVQAINNARLARCVGDIRSIGNEVTAAGFTTGNYPTMISEVGMGDMQDPWHNDYVYVNLRDPANAGRGRTDRFGVPINNNFDLYSPGADKISATSIVAAPSRDDVIWANDGAWMGLASQF